MDLADLISRCSDDVEFQNLDHCAKSLDFHHKRGTSITFVTTMSIHLDQGTEKLGLIVWLDRNRVAEIMREDAALTTTGGGDGQD